MSAIDFQESISFIIPSYNSSRTIGRTIGSILTQTERSFVREILVVDSSDDSFTPGVLGGISHPLFRLVRLNQKTPPSRGRNIGARQSQGRVLCFIDSDVELSPDWVRSVIKAWLAGSRMGGGSVMVSKEQKRNLLVLAQFYLQFNEFMKTGVERVVPFLPSCNMFCDRELFFKAGGFPDLRASEDTLFCLNAGKLSPVWFVPEAGCFHLFREEWRGFLGNQQLLGKSVMIYRRLYYRAWFYDGWWPVVFLPAFLTIKAVRMTARIVKGGPGHFLKFVAAIPVFIIGFLFWSLGFLAGCFTPEKESLIT